MNSVGPYDGGCAPEYPGVVVLGVEALVGRHHPVEEALAGVEAAQALHQPPVTWGQGQEGRVGDGQEGRGRAFQKTDSLVQLCRYGMERLNSMNHSYEL